ncbi:MAG: response regulator transcription factor [Chloroflexi bacterium]|nr:response regulator transcription factor [Chloroflexota bacterium]MCL5951878.1 response regulator transcription factor [Chloroflexota bacterium]
MRVLLADDHPLFRDGLAALLRARGMEVVGEASNGLEALEKARALKPELVLMDVNMPQMNGLEATRLIKTEMPETKIVILTVSDDDEVLFEAIKSGAQGYLLKSLQSQAFFELLNGVAQGEAPISRGLATKILGEFARHLQQDAAQSSNKEDLTDREKEVLRLVAEGSTNRDIAVKLNVTENTVKYHLKNILEKLHLRNRAQAVAYAMQTGLLKKSVRP